MKKLFVVALAAMAMVSCVNDELVDVKGGDAIAFGEAILDNATRAAVDPSITQETIDGFNVWGIMDDVTGTVFTAEEVTGSVAGGWTYANTQYWTPSHKYYFGALAPMNSANWDLTLASTTDAAVLGLGTVEFDNIDGSEDLLYAKEMVATAADINAQPAPVKLQFQHLLSKVKFTFENGFMNENAKIFVKDIKMTAANAGTIDLAVADYSKGWVLGTATTAYEFGDLEVAKLGKGEKKESAKERLFIPAADDYVYTIEFTVELYMGDKLAQTFNETTELTGVELAMGNAYNFTATLSNKNLGLYPITFEVDVDEWVPAQPDVNTDPTTAIVTNDAELAAAIANEEIENIKMKAGNYTMAKYRAGAKLVGLEDGVVIDVQGKKFGVNGDVYAENVKLVFSNANYTGFQHTNVEVYKNCTIVGQPFLYGNDVTFDTCVFEQESANAYNVWTYGAKNVKFNNCEFKSAGKAVLVYCETKTLVQNVELVDCELTASAPAAGKAAVEIDSSLVKEYTVTITNTTATGFDAGNVSGNTLYNNKKGTNATVIVDGVEVVKAGYTYVNTAADLAAALLANKEDIKVVLNSDIDCPMGSLGQQTGGSGEYKLGGDTTNNIVIDLNGKTLNITTSYMSAIGAKNENAIFTIKNGKMTSTGNSANTWNIYDLTFSNCNYVFEGVEFGKAIALCNAGKSVEMTDVTINETAVNDMYAMWVSARGQNIVLNNVTINNANGRGIKIDDQYVAAPAKVTMEVNGLAVTSAKKSAILVKSVAGAEINVNAIDLTNVAADKEFAVWVDEDAAAYADLVVVNGAFSKIEGVNTVIVDNAAELTAALAVDGKKTIVLATDKFEGTYKMTNNTTILGNGAEVGAIDLNGADNVTLKGITFDAANAVLGVDGKGAAKQPASICSAASSVGKGSNNVVIDGCTFSGTLVNGGGAIAFTDQARTTGQSGNITIKNCVFEVEGGYFFIYTYYSGKGYMNIENNTFKTAAYKPIYLGKYQSSTPVVVKGNAFEKCNTFAEAAYIQDHSNYGVSINASNNTYAE